MAKITKEWLKKLKKRYIIEGYKKAIKDNINYINVDYKLLDELVKSKPILNINLMYRYVKKSTKSRNDKEVNAALDDYIIRLLVEANKAIKCKNSKLSNTASHSLEDIMETIKDIETKH